MTDTTEFMIEPHTEADLKDRAIAKKIADTLNNHYPGHMWAVNVNSEQTAGVCNIFNFAISKRYGYVLHLATIERDPALKCVIKAGGEILERGNVKKAGDYAKRVEGVKEHYQPIKGMIQ